MNPDSSFLKKGRHECFASAGRRDQLGEHWCGSDQRSAIKCCIQSAIPNNFQSCARPSSVTRTARVSRTRTSQPSFRNRL